MEEIEVPIDQAQEETMHHAVHGSERWLSMGAVLSACLAVFAALSALTAGHHANEAMIEQIQASDKWSYYQAKGIKAAVLETRQEILQALNKSVPEKMQAKLEEYRSQQEEIQNEAKEKEVASLHHLELHHTLATSVTLFQVAIAITAISVLVRRRSLMVMSGTFGVVGLFFLVKGLFFGH